MRHAGCIAFSDPRIVLDLLEGGNSLVAGRLYLALVYTSVWSSLTFGVAASASICGVKVYVNGNPKIQV